MLNYAKLNVLCDAKLSGEFFLKNELSGKNGVSGFGR
jgi:hypothetical protein